MEGYQAAEGYRVAVCFRLHLSPWYYFDWLVRISRRLGSYPVGWAWEVQGIHPFLSPINLALLRQYCRERNHFLRPINLVLFQRQHRRGGHFTWIG